MVVKEDCDPVEVGLLEEDAEKGGKRGGAGEDAERKGSKGLTRQCHDETKV